MNKKIKVFVAAIAVLASVSGINSLQAQPPGGSGSPGGGSGGTGSNNGGTPGVPFDGGLSIVLIAAGSAVAAKRRKIANAIVG